MVKTFVLALIANITGHLIWILGLVNLAWLLVKDYQLFSWWWVIGVAITFVVSLAIVLLEILDR